MDKPKVEVRAIPDLVRVDVEIRRLSERIRRLEAQMQRVMQQGGPGWVTQVGTLALQLEKIIDSFVRTVHKYNSIKARLFK